MIRFSKNEKWGPSIRAPQSPTVLSALAVDSLGMSGFSKDPRIKILGGLGVWGTFSVKEVHHYLDLVNFTAFTEGLAVPKSPEPHPELKPKCKNLDCKPNTCSENLSIAASTSRHKTGNHARCTTPNPS